MSRQEPTGAYVYQPEPANSNQGYVFAVSGPNTEGFREYRFLARQDAQDVADGLNARTVTSSLLKALGRSLEAQEAIRKDGGR